MRLYYEDECRLSGSFLGCGSILEAELYRLLEGLKFAWKKLLNADWVCFLDHVFREDNHIADRMAKMGHHISMSSVAVFYSLPPGVLNILHEDCSSLALARAYS
ncbi:hypothetical protein ACOSQ4_017264 [Xanthoceras sorbifolium]